MGKRLIEAGIILSMLIWFTFYQAKEEGQPERVVSEREISENIVIQNVISQKIIQLIAGVDSLSEENLPKWEELTKKKEYTREEIVQEIMGFDFSLKEYPIDYSKYTQETDRIYKEAFLKTLTNQVPLYYPNEGEEWDAHYYQDEYTEGDTYVSDRFFRQEVLKKAEYYYMDFTKDGMPELIVISDYHGYETMMMIFQYDPQKEVVEVYEEYHSSGELGDCFAGADQIYDYDYHYEPGEKWECGHDSRAYQGRECPYHPRYDSMKQYEYYFAITSKKKGRTLKEAVIMEYDKGVVLTEDSGEYRLEGTTDTLGEFEVTLSKEEGERIKEKLFAVKAEKPTPVSFEQLFEGVSISQTNRPGEKEEAVRVYEEFLAGNREVKGMSIEGIFEEEESYTSGEGNKWFDYLICDASGDGIPELHIRTKNKYYIYKYENGIFFLWSEFWPYDFIELVILENGTIMGRNKDAYREFYYIYTLNSLGEMYLDLSKSFERWKQENEMDYDEESYYEYGGEECSMEEWTEKTGEYIYTDENGVQQIRGALAWIRYPIEKEEAKRP